MEPAPPSQSPSSGPRSRGSHKPRGGRGKYLRARGRGHGRGGRPAEFHKRLLLDGEQGEEIDEEEQEEMRRKYGKRQLESNAARYEEAEPELNEEGEIELEPEVDLAGLMAKQKLAWSDADGKDRHEEAAVDEEDDVDHSLASIGVLQQASTTRKGKVQQIEWDEELEAMSRDKADADATRALRDRFRVQAAKPSFRAPGSGASLGRGVHRQQGASVLSLPALPDDPKPKDPESKEGMEDFLDDLLG